jgi:beta-glucosidase
MNEKILKFPEGFLWGVSTSAYQIEGGNTNDWSEWETSPARLEILKKQGKDPVDFICGQACDSYNRYEEDLVLIKNLGCGAYRLGIEWSRIEPEEGKFDLNEIEHYRKILTGLKENKIKAVLTLWHWTNPKWIGSGGWREKTTVDCFLRFVDLVVRELGTLVDYWNPLNEPLMHIGHGYLDGKFPPNHKKDLSGALKVFSNLVRAQKSTYEVIHKYYPQAQVGVAMTTGYVEPAHTWNPIELALAKIGHYFRNLWYLNKINGFYDYIGVNYYHHDRIVWYPPFKKNLNKKVSDFGWEIFPEGIYHVLKSYKAYAKPILILESGISDARDTERADYIKEILSWMHQAMSEGADVKGHFYWSLLDNFEWADGYTQKFGLYSVDRKTFVRTPRPSVAVYAEICKNNQLMLD